MMRRITIAIFFALASISWARAEAPITSNRYECPTDPHPDLGVVTIKGDVARWLVLMLGKDGPKDTGIENDMIVYESSDGILQCAVGDDLNSAICQVGVSAETKRLMPVPYCE